MQFAVTAFVAVRCGVGNVLPAVCPADVIAFAFHQGHELRFRFGVAHAVIDGVHQPELPALSTFCRTVFPGTHALGRLLLLLG